MSELLIRRANRNDLPGIIEIFRICLRETGNPPSMEFWKWKHLDNPFGESPVLLALVNDQIVGLRAFLSWNWVVNGRIFQSYRAVDTATHPDWQRKGIFSTLTSRLLNELWEEDPKVFIFNTPNEKSKPGYLKMGWQVLGKPYVNAFFYPFSRKSDSMLSSAELLLQQTDFDSFKLAASPNHKITTLTTPEYLDWRYKQIPDRKYGAWIYEGKQNVFFIFYLRKRKRFTELRVADYFVMEGSLTMTERRKAFYALAKQFGTYVVTTLWPRKTIFNSVLEKSIPDVTLRLPDDAESKLPGFADIGHWDFAMGSLELF